MNIEDLRTKLAQGPVEIEFVKVDGSIRVMLATTNTALFQYVATRGERYRNPWILTVWDLMNDGWRSIRIDRIRRYQS